MRLDKRHQAKEQRIVDDFNRCYPVGIRVVLRTDSGEIETTVTHPAQVLSGHTAVGWFQDVRGCYAIEGRVRLPAAA